MLCVAILPRPTIIFLSNFKTNEYSGVISRPKFKPKEEKLMLSFCGASSYYSPLYKEGFLLEYLTIKRFREEIRFTNAITLILFC